MQEYIIAISKSYCILCNSLILGQSKNIKKNKFDSEFCI